MMDRASATDADGSDAGNSLVLLFYNQGDRRKIKRLPDENRNEFSLGPPAMGINAAFMGLISNNYYRRLLRVKQAMLASSFPLSFLPFLTTTVVYTKLVSAPILQGETCSPNEAMARGALVGFLVSGLFPVLLTIPPNYRLAVLHRTIALPPKGQRLAFLWRVSKPVHWLNLSFALFQAACCGFMANTQFHTRAAHPTVVEDFP